VKNRKFCAKELDLLKKLKYENQKLKKEVSSLRKQMSRIDEARFEGYYEMLATYAGPTNNEMLIKKWLCYGCNSGVLKIKKLNTHFGIEYYRKCDTCGKTTELKPWSNDVTGLE